MIAFFRAKHSIRCLHDRRAQDGQPARERRRLLAELRGDRVSDRVDREPLPRRRAHDVRGEHEGNAARDRAPRGDDDRRHARAVRALEDALVLLGHGRRRGRSTSTRGALRRAARRAPPPDRRRRVSSRASSSASTPATSSGRVVGLAELLEAAPKARRRPESEAPSAAPERRAARVDREQHAHRGRGWRSSTSRRR